MPSLKVSVNTEAKSAFESYEGPTPPAGNGYEGVIKNVKVKNGKESGDPYLNVLLEHDSKDERHKKYNGAPQWIRVMFGDHDETQARLGAFIKAVTGKANKEANIVDTDIDARGGTGSLVKTIDGVNPAGKRVKFDLRDRPAQNGYAASVEGDFIRRILTEEVPAGDSGVDEVGEEDLEVEGEEEAAEDISREDREAELKKESLADLKAAAVAAEIDIKGLKKADLIEAILDWEFEDEDAADEDEESEEEEEVEGEEEEEEGDEEEEDSEEEDELDPEAELRAELADLDRTALKARLKEADAEAKVLKKDTDDDLRTKIVNAELGEPPF
jgi:hypothetical protein